MFPEDDYKCFEKMPADRQKKLLNWIWDNIRPIHTINRNHTSYELKHLVDLGEGEDNFFTNGEFKGAMLKAGYHVANFDEQNWEFDISEKSPVFTKGAYLR